MHRLLRALQHLIARSRAAADRHALLIVVGFSAMFFWSVIRRATMKPLWHDEIYTVVLASLPSLRTIWAAHHAGLDAMPPFNSMLTHGVFSVVGAGPIASRFPSMVGVWILAIVAFVIVRQRADTIAGLSAMLMTLCTAAAAAAYGARGYGVMLGLFALSLLSWSEAASGRHRRIYLPLLALTIAAGMWTHFYAALGVVPILAGELARLVRTRKPDWGVWLSVAAAGLASLPLLQLLKLASSQSATYFQRSSIGGLPNTYGEIGGALFSVNALGLGLLILAVALIPVPPTKHGCRATVAIPAHEIVAAVATMLIPVWAIAVGLFVSNAFVPRYVMSAVAGFVIVGPILAWRLRRDLASPLLCAVLIIVFFYSFRDVRPNAWAFQSPTAYRPLLMSALSKSKPVVVTGTLYLQMWYYLSENRDSLTYVADPDSALRILGTDSLERDYLVLRDWSSVKIDGYDAFVRKYPHFFLYSVESLTWLPSKLREDHREVREVGRESGATLYEVTER